jgi:hypothetical protein
MAMASTRNREELPAWAIEPKTETNPFSAKGETTINQIKEGSGSELSDEEEEHHLDQEEFEEEWHTGLKVFQMIEIGTVITACVLAFVDVYNIIVFRSTMSIKGGFMRLLGIAFSFLVVCLDFDKLNVAQELSIFENWLAKGIFYVYLGSFALSLDEGEAEVIDPDLNPFSNFVMFIDTVGALLMSLWGFIYLLMGLTCRKQVKELMQIEHHLIHGHHT